MTCDAAPALYLFRTRIGSLRGAASYAWLEVFPWLPILWPFVGWSAVLVVPAHVAFLGIYEIGYLYNDRARTSGERSSRPSVAVGSANIFMAVRVGVLGVAAALVAHVSGARAAGAFVIATGAIVLLSVIHTAVGARVRPNSPVRWMTFSWLAYAKYFPAVVAVVAVQPALSLLSWYFTMYGAGRVVEYAIDKHRGSIASAVLDVNAAWFISMLPVLGGAVAVGAPPPGVLAGAGMLGLHHVAASIFRWARGTAE
jgi:hypothetical protein